MNNSTPSIENQNPLTGNQAGNTQIEIPPILENTMFLRLETIIGNPSKNLPGLLPVSRTVFFDKIRDGSWPRPIKRGRSSLWRTQDIKNLLIELSQSA